MKKTKQRRGERPTPRQRKETQHRLSPRVEKGKKVAPFLLSLGLFLLLLLVGIGYWRFSASGKYVGKDPLPVTLAENNSQAYISWRSAGLKRRILVHIDSHIDLEWIPDPLLEKILTASSPEALRAVERNPYNIRQMQEKPLTIKNFIYPALREGMFRTVYWVTPEADLSKLILEYKKLLRESVGRITLEDLKTYRWQDNRLEITLFGTPFIITRLEDLPEFTEPVILDIDTDYFDPPYLGHRLQIPTLWPEEFVGILRAKKLQADLVDICYSVREGYLSLEYKYLADYVATLIRAPRQDNTPLLQAYRYHKEGDILRHQGDYDKAITAYQKALALTPDAPNLYYGLSLIYKTQGAEEAQADMYQKALALDPDYRHAQLYLGDSYYNKKLFSEAIPPYQHYLAQDPNHLAARFKLAYSLVAVGRESEAVETYRLLLAAYPEFSYAHHNLGLLLQRQGALEEAAAEYRAALRSDPFSFLSSYELGNISSRQENIVAAMQHYQQALEINPSHADSYYHMGLLLARQQRLEEAVKAFDTAVTIDPSLVQGYYNLGVAHAQQGNIEQAMSAYQAALRLNPTLAIAHNNLGSLYLKQQQLEQAMEEYEAALRYDPTLTMVYFSLGMLYAQRGMKEDAVPFLQHFIEQWQGEARYREIARRELEALDTGKGNRPN